MKDTLYTPSPLLYPVMMTISSLKNFITNFYNRMAEANAPLTSAEYESLVREIFPDASSEETSYPVSYTHLTLPTILLV